MPTLEFDVKKEKSASLDNSFGGELVQHGDARSKDVLEDGGEAELGVLTEGSQDDIVHAAAQVREVAGGEGVRPVNESRVPNQNRYVNTPDGMKQFLEDGKVTDPRRLLQDLLNANRKEVGK